MRIAINSIFARLAMASCVAVSLSLHSGVASAQVHERKAGSYIVRSNVIGSMMLDPDIARRHGIAPARNMAVLNVVIVAANSPTTARAQSVPGAVTARVLSSGRAKPLPLPMREIVENSGVSYVGTFGFTGGEEVEVHIRASPNGSSETADFQFRERMPPG